MNHIKMKLGVGGGGGTSEYTHLVNSPSSLSTSSESEDSSCDSSALGACGRLWRRLYLVEPAFLLFEIADWSSMALTTQYVYQNMKTNNTSELSHPSSLISNFSDNFHKHLDPHTSTGDVHQNSMRSAAVGGSSMADSDASYFVLYMSLLSSVPAVATTLLVCAYGDLVGRKPGLILPNLGGAFKALMYLSVETFGLPLWSLSVAHMLEGICGTHFTFTGSAHAYVADVTPQSRLTIRYTILQTLLLAASSIGNLGMGYLISAAGFGRCFTILLGCFTLGAVYIGFFLPESLPDKSPTQPTILEVVKGTAQAFCVYLRPRARSLGRLHLFLLLIVKLLNTIIFVGLVDVETLYLLAEPFRFTSVKIGYFLAECTLLNAFGPLIVVPLLQLLFSFSDVYICMVAALSGTLSFVLLGFSSNQAMVFGAPALGSLMAGISPTARSMMSKRVENDEQGALQASLSCLSVVSGIGGVSMYLAVYGATVNIFSGLVFLLVAILFVIINILLFVIACTSPPGDDIDKSTGYNDFSEDTSK